jgi:phage-related minor tail protein
MITTAAAGIGDAFSTSFKGIISGSMTAKEALASFFTSVADMFLDMAAQIIAKMIQMAILNAIVSLLPGSSGGGLGSSQFKPGAPAQMVPSLPNVPNYSGAFKARANGGPVSSGQTYMVGERGPELFVPGRSGTIVANDKMGGGSTNVVVNVDAKGSSVEGNEQGANQLGRVISAAVQSELIKQQRPGGILAR